MGCVTLLTKATAGRRDERSLNDEVIDGLHVGFLNGAILAQRVLILHAKRRKFLGRPLDVLRRESLRVGRYVEVANDERNLLAFGR